MFVPPRVIGTSHDSATDEKVVVVFTKFSGSLGGTVMRKESIKKSAFITIITFSIKFLRLSK